MSTGRIEIIPFESQALRGNPLGDPFIRKVPVYLPAGYDESVRRYPVVFLLTGFTGRGTMMLNDTWPGETIPDRLDRLIASGQVCPMIVVMPDCLTRYGGSQYLNSVATGRYEDHVVQELVPYIDAHYRTRSEAGQRVIAGKSSGGYGSVMLAMRHPEVFGLMVCHSGDMYFEYCYKSDFLSYLKGIGKYGSLSDFLRNLQSLHPLDNSFHGILNTAAMASCYSPNPASPLGFDLPFDEYTGEIREDVWARWLEWDPVYLVDRYVGALRQLRLIFVDCGLRDEFNLQYGARIFTHRLKAHNIPCIHEEFDDGHMNIAYRYDSSLVAVARVLEA